MSPLGLNEIIIILVIGIFVFLIPLIVVYQFGKQRGRREEMKRQELERKMNELSGRSKSQMEG